MDKWICQTFWTKPMSEKTLNCNINIAAISLYYAHRSGYMVKMYTDTYGKELLRDIDYDIVVTDLDDIPNDIPTRIFAYPKIIALQKEPLGVIHTDFDVFIKKPCLDPFYDDEYDCILQNTEDPLVCDYNKGWDFFKKTIYSELNHNGVCNVGVIGFNNPKMKEIYISHYLDYVTYFKDKIKKLDFLPDLFFEQVSIDRIIKKYKFNTYFILPINTTPNINNIAKEKGYQHIFGSYKYTDEAISIIKEFKNKLYGYKNRKIKVVWSSPCTGKTTYTKKDNKYCVDFDEYKIQHNIHVDMPNYRKELFELYNKVCAELNGSNKILLCSDVELLHAFYRDFDAIYTLNYNTLCNRIMKRDGANYKESSVDGWVNTIYNKLNFIKIYNIRKINYLKDDEYIEDRLNELLSL